MSEIPTAESIAASHADLPVPATERATPRTGGAASVGTVKAPDVFACTVETPLGLVLLALRERGCSRLSASVAG